MTIEENPYVDLSCQDILKYFVDPHNQAWFDNVVKSDFIFRVQADTTKKAGDTWRFCGANQYITITCPLNDINKNIFTHELLHSYFYVNGYYSTKRLDFLKEKGEKFEKAFGTLEGGLLNAFQHLKMYPMFREAGYDTTQFVTDSPKDHNVNDRFDKLKSKVPYGQFFKEYIELFSISINDPSKENDHKYISGKLEKVDESLFEILHDTADKWTKQVGFNFDNLYEILINRLADICKNNCAD